MQGGGGSLAGSRGAFHVEPREPEGGCEVSGMIPCVAETMLVDCH